MRRSPARRRAPLAVAFGLLVAGCTAGPPPLVAPPPSAVPAVPTPTREAVVGVDDLSGGFNPHTLADLTPVGSAVAGLVLPSAFRQTADGGWQLDDALLASAEVTDTEPMTVTYRIRFDASWSDGAPIAAEDFVYLAEQMRTRPGVVGGAGYQLIDEVASADGGKTVRVSFRTPYPAWRSLFRHLLPAHLLKDAPGGWTDALDAGIPVSGGPFSVTPTDPARRELVLRRNDRYWDDPATVDRVVLRQIPDAEMAAALRTGGVQAALFGRPDASTTALLTEAGFTAPAVVPQPSVAHVLLRPVGGPMDEVAVRTAVAAALDRDSLIAIGVGSGPSAGLVADAQILAPSLPGYRPTAPEEGPPVQTLPQRARELLDDAGYDLGPQGWERGGRPLELTIAAPEGRDPYPVLAERVAAQLQAVGIGSQVITPSADDLFETRLAGEDSAGDSSSPQPSAEPGSAAAGGGVDIAVVPQAVGADPATMLASQHGCPIVTPAGLPMARANTAGFCDPELQPLIEDVLTGRTLLSEVSPMIETALWDDLVTVPLYQHAGLLVTTPALRGVRPGPLLEGPFDGAAQWQVNTR